MERRITMSKMSEVTERLKTLPERKRLRHASQTMKVFRERIDESAAHLKGAIDTCRAVATIVGEGETQSVVLQAKKASRKASSLLKRLSPTGDDGRFDAEAVVAAVTAKKSDNVVT